MQSVASPKAQGSAKKDEAPASLQVMEENALTILKRRRKSLFSALQYIAVAGKAAMEAAVRDPLQKSIVILTAEIKALDEDISKQTRSIDALGEHVIPDDAASPTAAQEDEEDLFGDKEAIDTIPSQGPQATEIPEPSPQSSRAPSSSLAKPPPKPLQKSSALMRSTPKRTSGIISRPPRPIGDNKAAKTTFIDASVALQAEQIGLAAEKKQKNKGGNAAFFAKGSGSKPNSRLKMNDDGDLIFRKKAAETVVGEKRKRVDVLEGPKKRSAIEGRNFAPLRVSPVVQNDLY